MKLFKFSVDILEAENIWDFSLSHRVNFDYLGIVSGDNQQTRYAYNGLMEEETFTVLKLMVTSLRAEK